MSRFYALEVANTEAREVSAKSVTVNSLKGRITKEVDARIEADKEANRAPRHDKEYDPMRACKDNVTLAQFCAEFKINPRVLFNSSYMDDAALAKANVNPLAKTRNLKALSKLQAIAALIMSADMKSEAILHTFTACALVSSRFGTLQRDVVERFINSNALNGVNSELAELIAEYRAEHITGGAPTQTSQITLLLGLLGVLDISRDGRSKSYKVNRSHPITQAIASRYGIELEQAA